MCTVSYIPKPDGFLLTSNRDEKKTRCNAISPVVYYRDNVKIIYPKDPTGDGTWIAIDNRGIAIVLLNGAFVKHKSEVAYRKSRGLILLDVINSEIPVNELNDILLTEIEPFTLIVCDEESLTELRWDGLLKHIRTLDSKEAKLWSSATLYDAKSSAKREEWFKGWLQENPTPLENDITDFHHFDGEEHAEGLIINRENVKTVSVTCVSLSGGEISMTYNDLQNEKIHAVAQVLY